MEVGPTVSAMDILFPGIGEIVGGSQREERLDVLKQKIAEFNIPEEHVWWYLDTRKFGSVPHSGFGLGFERLMLFVTGMTITPINSLEHKELAGRRSVSTCVVICSHDKPALAYVGTRRVRAHI